MLTKEQILAADDIRSEVVSVPEWGGDVRIQSMSGMARDRYEQALFEGKNSVSAKNIRAKLVASSAVDDSGNLLFSETDIEALGKKSAKALDRLFAVAQRINGVTSGDVEELEKNLEADPSAVSTSD